MERTRSAPNNPREKNRLAGLRIERVDLGNLAAIGADRSSEASARQLFEALFGLA